MKTQSIYKSPEGEQTVMALYDSLLARWPVAYHTLTVPTRHGDTYVIVSENHPEAAPPLVLLHGAGSNALAWGGDVAAYSRHYQVFAVDLPGEPGKSTVNRPAWEGPAYAEWLEDVLTGLTIDKVMLVGLSQGAWTALKFAVSKPERVKKMALISPGGIVPDKLSFFIRVLPLMWLGKWGIRRINRLVMGPQALKAEVAEVLTVITTHFKPRLGVLPIFTEAELQRLTMPVLLLMGAQDVMRDAQKIKARMQPFVPNLTVHIRPAGGHALLDTTTEIIPFLEK